eukprot:7461993-Pyramimonas_sp.AAC.1
MVQPTISYPPPWLWAWSGRILRSFAQSPEPQSSLLRSLEGGPNPNPTSPLGVGGLGRFLFHPSFFPFGE